MFLVFNIFAELLVFAAAGPTTESYKGQYCTDPRTMLRHPAYTEWADAYSCTRHRCQPGGRNLAIYTVGCKRVEAPESAIECEEVVEDTNMQFPFCCTRLRCLVVVRGEVWTRVLGQPWETLPAAPWSHMYKMKRPPPGAGEIAVKSPKAGEGPIYELAKPEENRENERVLRSKNTDNQADSNNNDDNNNINNEIAPHVAPAPDIVIALSTNDDLPKEVRKKSEGSSKHRRGRKHVSPYTKEVTTEPNDEVEDSQVMRADKDKAVEPHSEEQESRYVNSYGVTQKSKSHQVSRTESPQQSNDIEHEQAPEVDSQKEQQPSQPAEPEKPEAEKSGNLQALVDAIGTRMRDIEHVVRRMSDTVGRGDEAVDARRNSGEGAAVESESPPTQHMSAKKPNPDGENYNRFSSRAHGASKYLQPLEGSTEPPLFVEDSHLGYFSDASNTVLRRAPKEPPPMYMAPVENRRRSHLTEGSDEEKKKKKHSHKKKKSKGHPGHHKKHRPKEDKRKRFNRVNSVELDKNAISLEDNSAGAAASA